MEELSWIVEWRKREWARLLGELAATQALVFESSRPVKGKVNVKEEWRKQFHDVKFVPVLCLRLSAPDLCNHLLQVLLQETAHSSPLQSHLYVFRP